MIPQGDNRRYQAGRGYPLKFQKNKRDGEQSNEERSNKGTKEGKGRDTKRDKKVKGRECKGKIRV